MVMPHLHGYYYDPEKNRYFKGKPPKPPPPQSHQPTLLKSVSLPRLLHSTALGQPTTQSHLHATLFHPATPSTDPITLTQPHPSSPPSHDPSETLAYKLPNAPLNVLTFPDSFLTAYRYASAYPPLSIASYDRTVAYATGDGVYLHQGTHQRSVRRKYQLPHMRTVSLSSRYLLMAGDSAKLYPVTRAIAPAPPRVFLSLRHILSSHLVKDATFALGTRQGTVHFYQHGQHSTTFHPSGKRRSVTSLRISDNLVWCSTMRGGTNLSAWDIRDFTTPAIVCNGHSNECKMVGMDAAGSLVIAGGDDEKVRVWDIRGGGVLTEIAVKGVVKRVKMVGWNSDQVGACGVWLDTGDDIYARVVAR